MQKKPGLALDGQIKHEDTYLASSTMYVPATTLSQALQSVQLEVQRY